MTGALADSFPDYVAAIDVNSGKLISVSAEREFSDFSECSEHLKAVGGALKTRFKPRVERDEPYVLKTVSGPVEAYVMCSSRDGSTKTRLVVHVSHSDLSKASKERLKQLVRPPKQ